MGRYTYSYIKTPPRCAGSRTSQRTDTRRYRERTREWERERVIVSYWCRDIQTKSEKSWVMEKIEEAVEERQWWWRACPIFRIDYNTIERWPLNEYTFFNTSEKRKKNWACVKRMTLTSTRARHYNTRSHRDKVQEQVESHSPHVRGV